MRFFYSKLTGGFYEQSVHGDAIPSDAVAVTEEYHQELLEGQSTGMRILGDKSGLPQLIERDPPTPDEIKITVNAAVKAVMDRFAQAYGYEDLRTAISFAEEPAVPKYQTEGQAFRSWRSEVRQFVEDSLADLPNGDTTMPDIEALVGALPILKLPPYG